MSLENIEKDINTNNGETIVENAQENTIKIEENESIQEQFDKQIEELKTNNSIEQINKLYNKLAKEYKNGTIDAQYFKYATQYITDTYFSKMKGMQLTLKVILKRVCIDIQKTTEQNIEFDQINILTIGTHIKNDRILQDTICIYKGNFISIFGIYEDDDTQFETYEKQTYIQPNIMQAMKKYMSSSKSTIEKYESYYLITDSEEDNSRTQIYKQKQEKALAKTEETGIAKIRAKLCQIFGINKRKILANMEKIYDTKAGMIEDILQERQTKENAKNRMKVLLQLERKLQNQEKSDNV